MVSIIVPIYNAEKYLDNCIQSILKQTYSDFELLLINDGSTDSSLKISNEYKKKDRRISVYSKLNGGVSSARNLGICKAQGRWITFVDADDEILPEWLENFIKSDDNKVDIIFQGAKIIDHDGEFQFELNNQTYLKHNYANLINTWYYSKPHIGSAWSKMVKSDILINNNIRFNQNISYYEDWVFLTDFLAHSNQAKTISKTGYIYNQKNSVLTGNNIGLDAQKRIQIFRARYSSLIYLREKDEKSYHICLPSLSVLLMQMVYKIYVQRKDFTRKERIEILNDFSTLKINSKDFNWRNRLVNTLFIRKRLVLSDFLLSIFRFIN